MDYRKNPTTCVKTSISLSFSYLRDIGIITGLYVLTALGVQTPALGLGIAALEWIVLILMVILGNYFNSFCFLIVFIMTSFETTTFITKVASNDMVVYSIYSLPYIRSILCYAFIIFLTIVFKKKYYVTFKANIKNFPEIRTILKFFPFMFISGAITGYIVYLLNDNGVALCGWYLTKYVEFTIKIITLMSLIYSTTLICVSDQGNREKLELLCEKLIISAALATTITLAMGMRGYYGNKGSLIFMPLATSIAASLILFYGFRKTNGLVFLVIGVIFTAEILFVAGSQMGSKFYIIPVGAMIILILNGIKNGRIGTFAGIAIIMFIIILGGGINISSLSFGRYNNWKFNQLLQTIDFSRNNITQWYSKLPDSPRIRIDEFMSTLCEYIQKPGYLLFGKGTAGTITHLWGNTVWTVKGKGTFSDYEIDSRIFMFMHESLNVLFIRHGLLGLCFFVYVIIMLLKKLLKTPWAMIALIWFVFYWGTYRSWWIGVVAFVLALTIPKDYGSKTILS